MAIARAAKKNRKLRVGDEVFVGFSEPPGIHRSAVMTFEGVTPGGLFICSFLDSNITIEAVPEAVKMRKKNRKPPVVKKVPTPKPQKIPVTLTSEQEYVCYKLKEAPKYLKQRLREAIDKLGLSQRGFAKEANCDVHVVFRLFRWDRLSLYSASKIATAIIGIRANP